MIPHISKMGDKSTLIFAHVRWLFCVTRDLLVLQITSRYLDSGLEVSCCAQSTTLACVSARRHANCNNDNLSSHWQIDLFVTQFSTIFMG